jgi:TolB protein
MYRFASRFAILILLTGTLAFSTGLMLLAPSVLATKGSYSGVNGKIAFTATVNSREAIFIMNEDGTDIQQLTDGTKYDILPCWSPDGTKIAFGRAVQGAADSTIWVVDSDGSGLRQLTSGDRQTAPAWSPDGTKIMFDKRESGSNDGIYVIDANGPTGPGTLLVADGLSPSWSPDGSKIVFYSSGNIYLAHAQTGSVIGGALAEGYDPCWSPDGLKITFVGSDMSIWVMNEDGSSKTKLTAPGVGEEDSHPNWSPDGTKIIYDRNPSSVWIMNADGSNGYDLTPTVSDARQPDYQRRTQTPVGGSVMLTNKLEILTPYLALAGLVVVVSAMVVVGKRE